MNFTISRTKFRILAVLSAILMLFSVSSCDNDSFPEMESLSGSFRDWRYPAPDRAKLYLDGNPVSSVSEILVQSDPMFDSDRKQILKEEYDEHGQPAGEIPLYKSAMKIYGFPKKNKNTVIWCQTTWWKIYGETEINGTKYRVEGEFTGHFFEDHYKDQGIILRLTSI